MSTPKLFIAKLNTLQILSGLDFGDKTIGIAIRILFVPFDIPLTWDNFTYFMYATDHSLGQNSPMQVSSNGWPLFVSFFFSLYNSDNFLDYMALQRILSVVTIYNQ